MHKTVRLGLVALVAIHAQHALAQPAPQAPAGAATEVTVAGRRSEAEQLQRSAEAVTVVELKHAKQQTTDLGEVLARTQGVSVRRSGGVGSEAVISLNGLQGQQVRTFVDGVPIELSAYPGGIVDIPVNLVERVEVYRGVVPARFGMDALGGAINVVTSRAAGTRVHASYQIGSFGLHRLNATASHESDNFVVGANAFVDIARNNYIMSDRMVARPDGRSDIRDVERFHSGYRAYGGHLQAGLIDQRWARRLQLRAFASGSDEEIQHNPVMTIPYGAVESAESKLGGNLEYEVPLLEKLDLELLLNYAHRAIDFRDLSEYAYRWTGERGRRIGVRGVGRGETTGEPYDSTTYENLLLARVGLLAPLHPQHNLRLITTTQLVTRSVHGVVEGEPQYGLVDQAFQVVTGLEYEHNLFEGRLSNIVMGKHYYFQPTTQVRVAGPSVPEPYLVESSRDTSAWGIGDSLRYAFTPWLLAKASYEYAVRLPNAEELFGDGVFVTRNAELKPERSHNINVGPRVELNKTVVGDVIVDVNGFWRATSDQIVLIAGLQFMPYRNIADMRTRGVEGSLFWSSPGRWVMLDGTFTFMDSVNVSKDGPFSAFEGLPVPNRPYRFGSWGARFHASDFPFSKGTLDVFYAGRYVHGFYRGWDVGNPEFKMSVPSQVGHNVGITTTHRFDWGGRVTFTFEVDNLANAKLFDVYGVQRPGRSFNFKVLGQL